MHLFSVAFLTNCGSPHNSYNNHLAMSVMLANENWTFLLVCKKQIKKFIFSSSQSHFQYGKLCWPKPSKKTAREYSWRRCLRNFTTRIPIKTLELWHRVSKQMFSTGISGDCNPLQNIIRLFFRVFFAAENECSHI